MNALVAVGAVVGLISGVLTIYAERHRPPTPRCPKCNATLYNPGAHYSECHQCGQLIDWWTRRAHRG